MSTILAIVGHLNAATVSALRNTIVLAIIFTLLPRFVSACNKTPVWWRKPDLSTDLCWIFVPSLLYEFAQTLLVILGIMICYGIHEPGEIANFFAVGQGPFAHVGFWPGALLYLLGSDLVMYFTHRLFHGDRLWRFHAVHHASKHLEWISAARFHPVDHIFHGIISDVVMLLLGISPDILIWMMPFNVGTSALVHANVDWSFGPFRYVLASPVFHRWHHTNTARGGSRNFAATLPFIDLMFGTFYMPPNQHPDAYGIDDTRFPDGFVRQLLVPFLPRRLSQQPVESMPEQPASGDAKMPGAAPATETPCDTCDLAIRHALQRVHKATDALIGHSVPDCNAPD